MQKLIFLVLLCALFPLSGSGQDFNGDFAKASEAKDTAAMHKVLTAWEHARPEDPELFTAYFNYYVTLADRSAIALTANTMATGESLIFADSLGNPAGSLRQITDYDGALVQKGIAVINRGIALHPNRLDMYFGKIYVLGLVKDWEAFTESVLAVTDRSAVNHNQWLWTNNAEWESGRSGKEKEADFLECLQDYQNTLYRANDNALLGNMRRIAEAVLRHYPDDVRSINNIAVSYVVERKYAEALPFLLRAEKYAPEDTVVLSNIAEIYRRLGNKKRGRRLYGKSREGRKESLEREIVSGTFRQEAELR